VESYNSLMYQAMKRIAEGYLDRTGDEPVPITDELSLNAMTMLAMQKIVDGDLDAV